MPRQFSRIFSVFVLSVASAFLFANCASTPQGAGDIGQQIAIFVSEGDPAALTVPQFKQRTQVKNHMQKNLAARLNKAGFIVASLNTAEEYYNHPGALLLMVNIDNYDPGNAAARAFVGYGAGACALDVSAYLYSGEHLIDSWREGDYSTMTWGKIVKKLNVNITKRVQQIMQSLPPQPVYQQPAAQDNSQQNYQQQTQDYQQLVDQQLQDNSQQNEQQPAANEAQAMPADQQVAADQSIPAEQP